MTDKLATVLMTSPCAGFGAGVQWWLLEQYNCSLGNNLPASQCDPSLVGKYPDAKHIIPMFGYKESWSRLRLTFMQDAWEHWLDKGNVYYFNMGDGDWNGLDEPGTRGDIFKRRFNYGRAYQEVEMVRALMPGLKTVCTHPFPHGFGTDCDVIPSDVWAWNIQYIANAKMTFVGPNWREDWGVPADKEVWGYWIDEDLYTKDLGATGAICRGLGLSACLIYKAEHPALWDADAGQMTAKGKSLLEGMVNA